MPIPDKNTTDQLGDQIAVSIQTGIIRAQAEELMDLRAQVAALKAELAAMTLDRNLWREAHDEDCPNILVEKE